jgi:CheY-like chemotaxis protein
MRHRVATPFMPRGHSCRLYRRLTSATDPLILTVSVLFFRHAPQTITPPFLAASSLTPPHFPNALQTTIIKSMIRPCFLVVDREYSGSISTRKLVIETAKLNVITAYSAQEAIATLRLFPNVHGVVLDAGVHGMPCCDLIAELKELQPTLPIVLISAPGTHDCPQADHQLESFEPAKLLSLLKTLAPAEAAAIERRNEELSEKES